MEAKHLRLCICSAEFFGNFCPHPTCSTKLSYFLEQIIMCIEEKRNTFGKYIYIQSFFNGSLTVLACICKSKSQFLHCSRSRLAYVVTRYRYGIPPWHFLAAIFKYVGYNAHRGCWRIYISPPCRIFFQDIILYSARYFFYIMALLFCKSNIHTQQYGSSGIDSHGGGYLFKVYTIQQNFHIP